MISLAPLFRRRAAAFTAAASLLATPAAFASQPPPAPTEDLTTYKVAIVQPVLAAPQDPLWTALGVVLGAAPAVDGAADRTAAAQRRLPDPQAGGLGFAGKATEGDVRLVTSGAALGFGLLLAVAEDDRAAELFGKIQAARGDFAALTPEVQRLVARITAIGTGAEQGDLGALYAQLLQAAADGIATATADNPAPARAHGYFTTSLWASLAMVATFKGHGASFAGMAEPLALMLEEDASFGGADRRLAGLVRNLGAELQKPAPSFEVVAGFMDAMMDVKAD